MTAVVDLDEYRARREAEELGPARWLTLDDVIRECAASASADTIERAIASVLAEPDEPAVYLEPDDEPAPKPRRYRRRPADSGCQHGGSITFGRFVGGIAPAHCWACGLRWQVIKQPRDTR